MRIRATIFRTVAMLLFITGLCNITTFAAGIEDPIIWVATEYKAPVVGEEYGLGFKVNNMKNIDNCKVLINYDPEILRLDFAAGITPGNCEYSYAAKPTDQEGQVLVSITHEKVFECSCNNRVMIGFATFEVIKEGNPCFSAEIIDNNCYKGSIQVDLAPLHEGFIFGDINADDICNAKDALMALKMAVKLEESYKWEADLDKDGIVNATDALIMLKKAANIL